MFKTGIYAIVNTKTCKRYIGSACNVPKRWSTHKNQLRNGRHHNTHLQRSFDKYGEVVFQFQYLEKVSRCKLISVEQEWIDRLWDEGLYNVRRDAASNLGVKHTEEARQKMRENYSGMTPERQAASRLHSDRMTGRVATVETRKKMSKSKLGYSHTKEARLKMSESAKNRSFEHLSKLADSRAGEYIITTPEGEELKIRNLSAFARENGLQQAKLSAVALGKANHHKGYKARRITQE